MGIVKKMVLENNGQTIFKERLEKTKRKKAREIIFLLPEDVEGKYGH